MCVDMASLFMNFGKMSLRRGVAQLALPSPAQGCYLRKATNSEAGVQRQDTIIPGVAILTPDRFGDARGFFEETYNARTLAGLGIDTNFVQDNHSLSERTGTLRGLHFQAPPHAQAKLVRCGRGRFLDVAVDIRQGSPAFGKWVAVELSFENGKMLYMPEGIAHGLVTRAPATEVVYKCSDFYAPETEGAVIWNDPDIGIDWRLDGDPVLSGKDASAPLLSEIETPFVYGG